MGNREVDEGEDTDPDPYIYTGTITSHYNAKVLANTGCIGSLQYRNPGIHLPTKLHAHRPGPTYQSPRDHPFIRNRLRFVLPHPHCDSS